MFRRRFLSLPLVVGASVIGVVSGQAIFGPPLEEYWKKKHEEEAAAAAAAAAAVSATAAKENEVSSG